MATPTVPNATGVFATLGYNYTNPNGAVVPYSNTTLTHIQTVPPVIKSWQAQDIASNSVDGYVQNPISGYVHNISDAANTILAKTPIVSTTGADFSSILTSINFLSFGALNATQNSQTFLEHTDRLCNVRQQSDDANVKINGTDFPYYQTATSLGKSASYILYQTDGVANTAAVMGSFTSILDRTQLSQISSTIVTDSAAIVASLTYVPSEISGYYTSSLSPTIVTKYTRDFSNAVTYMTTHETADKTFYKNLKDMMAKYNSTKQYVNMGDSESYLINNFIGTPKLISRVNS